ncbi:MAG: right-handed parallel beta-helix repeat-containing protein [Spirochaetia bacterium]|nr:right-handed parallel beta-helix repeat-containing protein [Spirochaetia bacterium]
MKKIFAFLSFFLIAAFFSPTLLHSQNDPKPNLLESMIRLELEKSNPVERTHKGPLRVITMTKGFYPVQPGAGRSSHLLIENQTNLLIDFTGVNLICLDIGRRAVDIKNCTNVVICGLTVDYDPLPFTQGALVAFSKESKTMTVHLHEGYPELNDPKTTIRFFDPKTRVWKSGAWSGGIGAVLQTKSGRVLVFSTPNVNSGSHDAVAVGDLVVMKQKLGVPHVVVLDHCASTTLSNVTIHTGPTFAVLDTFCDRMHYFDVRITPGPKPLGAREPRLMANLADGIHSIGARNGPLVERCLIECHADDGVAIHGKYWPIVAGSGREWFVASTSELPLLPGDTLRLTKRSGLIFDETVIESASPVEEGRVKELVEARDKLGYRKELLASENKFTRLVFGKAVAAEPGDAADSPQLVGSGFVVRDNVIRNHRARGILIKASSGKIENNLIEGSSMAGIVLSPELDYWHEAGYSWDVLIQGNVIRATGYEHPNPGVSQAGIITVCATGGKTSYAPAGGHRNIRILNNKIESSEGVHLLATSVSNLLIQGNEFIQPLQRLWPTGGKWGIDGKSVVVLDQCSQVTLAGNKVVKPGPAMGKILTFSADTQIVKGAEDGILPVK